MAEKKQKEDKKEKVEPQKEVKKDKIETEEDREILKKAEERESERKIEDEMKKAEAKKAELIEKEKEKAHKESKKPVQIRRKPRHGKKYRELLKLIEKDKEYPISEAIDLILKTSPAKFDATVELHARINKKEKNVRGMITFPGGVVKEKKILEVTDKNIDDVAATIKSGKIEFDLMIADIKLMPRLAPLAKILGPKGLMPSPKAGTAVEDVKKAAEELKGGKTEYRADKDNIVHMAIGKISFGKGKIHQNYEALINALPQKRVESLFIASTMGPSVKILKK